MSNELLISSETIENLKKFSEINQSIIIQAGNVLKSISINRSVYANSIIKETFPRKLCIYDLGEFISALSLFDSPILEFEEGNESYIIIKDENTSQKLKYIDSEEALINSYPSREMPPINCEVVLNLSKELFKKVNQAANSLKMNYVGFESDGKDIYIRTFNLNNGDESETNSFKIRVGDGDGSVFNFFVNQKVFKLFDEDFELKLSSSKLIIAKSKERELQYYISMEKKSFYNAPDSE